MSDWAIETTERGTFDVTNGSRPVSYDEPTLEDAERVVSEKGGRSYVQIEADGYRTPKTL